MPRRRDVAKRLINPDPKFNDTLLTQFVNSMMRDGKKSVAEQIMYETLDTIEEVGEGDALEIFRQAIDNVRPAVEVRSRRVGGSTYQVPIEIRGERRTALAIRWLLKGARGRAEKTMVERLSNEFLDASNGRGASVRKKDEVHRMADANKAFAHYRW